MLIRTFKKSYLLQYLLLALFHLILWGGAFIKPFNPPSPENPLLNPAYSLVLYLLGDNPYIYVLLGFLLVMAASLVFNYTLEKNELAGSNSLIPAFTFIIVMSLFPGLQGFYPSLVAGLLIIFMLDLVFDIYTMEDAYSKVFYSGFLIAISSFFYFPSVGFLLFMWFVFILYRIYRWREWVILIFGFLSPYILLWTYFFWIDELTQVFHAYGQYFTPKAVFNYTFNLTILNYISMGLVVILFFRAFLTLTIHIQENVISVRKRFWAVILFLIVSILSFLFSGNLSQYHVVFIQVSMAMIIQGLLFMVKRVVLTEIFLGVIIILILINNYYLAFQSS